MRVAAMIGVLMTPGQIALTPTPAPRQSTRRLRDSASTAALLALYADSVAR